MGHHKQSHIHNHRQSKKCHETVELCHVASTDARALQYIHKNELIKEDYIQIKLSESHLLRIISRYMAI